MVVRSAQQTRQLRRDAAGKLVGFFELFQAAEHVGRAELDVLVAFFRRRPDAPNRRAPSPTPLATSRAPALAERGQRHMRGPGAFAQHREGRADRRSHRPARRGSARVHGRRARGPREPRSDGAAIVERRLRVVLTAPCASVAVRLTVVFSAPRVITVSCGSLPLQTASG